jgi:hypothetical protein
MYIVRESGDKVSGRDDSAALSSVDGWNDILWCLHFSLLQEDCKLTHALVLEHSIIYKISSPNMTSQGARTRWSDFSFLLKMPHHFL